MCLLTEWEGRTLIVFNKSCLVSVAWHLKISEDSKTRFHRAHLHRSFYGKKCKHSKSIEAGPDGLM